MARVNGRMPGNSRVWPKCRGGYGCCSSPIEDKHAIDRREIREELALADEELVDRPNELEPDPNWDGAWDYGPDDLADVEYVKFIPAPRDDSGW